MCSKMEECEKREKVTSTNRRNNKPLMEKRRRQRINDSLVQLKSLVLQAMNKDTTQYSKLEKADILEMTVKHLKMVQRQQITAGIASDPNAISKYRAGFNDCAAEIARYLDNVNGGNPQLKARVMGYLSNSMLQFPVIPVYQGVIPPFQMQMTSPATSQGFQTSTYSQMTPSCIMNNQYQSQFPLQSQMSACDMYKRLPQNDSPVKLESPESDIISPPSSSQITSPDRRVPSPCDSDSGLSDISTSVPHDENGNYPHFNSNHHARLSDVESSNYVQSLNRDTRKRCYTDMRISPKAKDLINDTHHTIKRQKLCDIKVEPGRELEKLRTNDPMWRPW